MAEEKYVPLKAFAAALKGQFSLINELTVSIMTLRAALMQANKVPVSPEELKRLDAFFRELPQIRAAREALEKMDLSTTEAIDQLLRNFEGPVQ
jgi:hypothetical protein